MNSLNTELREGQLPLPKVLLDGGNSEVIQVLFNAIRSPVLYLDQWGRVCSANIMARELFHSEQLLEKTILELLSGWDDPVHCHYEILLVARTGKSILGSTERAVLNGREHWFQADKIAVRSDQYGVNGVLLTLDDITEMHNKSRELEKSDHRYKSFVNNSQDSIWRFDIVPPLEVDLPKDVLAKEIVERAHLGDCNTVFARSYGASSIKSLVGMRLKTAGAQSYINNVDEFVENNFSLSSQDIVWENRKSEMINLQISANGTVTDGKLVEVWGITRDSTEKQRYIDRLKYQANHDLLTGLPNRSCLQQTVENAILNVENDVKLALCVIDLDEFKEVNDTLGHHIGDRIVMSIGPRLKKCLEGFDATVSRIGGDEFAILLPKIQSKDQVQEVCEKVLRSIRHDFYIDELAIDVRASLGVALFPDQAKDFSTLLRMADVAMYSAKQSQVGVEFYTKDTDQYSTKRLSLISDLGKAIREKQLTLYYQPKIDLDTLEVIGVETLCRWIHPTMGFISPNEFVPIAEATDMINDMTDMVLEKSLSQLNAWQEKNIDVKIAVNISFRNLANDKIVDRLQNLLTENEVAAKCLELEITESTIMKNAESSLSILQKISDLGIELSIDDFGTGYSSLAYLKKLPVNWLKLDYSFISHLITDEQDRIIVDSTVKMAHNLGLKVVAEGVENSEVIECLQKMGCEQAQGFFIARPMPADEFETWYANYQK